MEINDIYHQRISHLLSWKIENYIQGKKGTCQVFAAPFAVFLMKDEFNYVEPDISVICNQDKLNEKGCSGAPGVREYWIINPLKKAVMVYDFEHEAGTNQYVFDDTIPACIYKDLSIDMSELLLSCDMQRRRICSVDPAAFAAMIFFLSSHFPSHPKCVILME
ncbi:MAG: Uma2 family endonuclease [Lachnospiraceae bacterium]|nr:Uma2 family endonuclease [Muribaculaceae bacterium]MCM1411022.1 Uma2 family endonuclease [Lachnospiraceae bacterium]